jgi:hypothetical protein
VTRHTDVDDNRRSPVFRNVHGPKGAEPITVEDGNESRKGYKPYGSTSSESTHGTSEDTSSHRKGRVGLEDSNRVDTTTVEDAQTSPMHKHQYVDPTPSDTIGQRQGPQIDQGKRGTIESDSNGKKISPLDVSRDSGDEDSEDDPTAFSPRRALAARRAAGPLYKAREKPKPQVTSGRSLRNSGSGGRLYQGRTSPHESVESLGRQSSDDTLEGYAKGPRDDSPGIGLPGNQMNRIHRSVSSEESDIKSSLGHNLLDHPRHRSTGTRSSEITKRQGSSPEDITHQSELRRGNRPTYLRKEKSQEDLPKAQQGQEMETGGTQDPLKVIEAEGKKLSVNYIERDRQIKQAVMETPSEDTTSTQGMSVGDLYTGKQGQQKTTKVRESQGEGLIVNKYTSTQYEQEPASQFEERVLSVSTSKSLLIPPKLLLSPPSFSSFSPKMWSSIGQAGPFSDHFKVPPLVHEEVEDRCVAYEEQKISSPEVGTKSELIIDDKCEKQGSDKRRFPSSSAGQPQATMSIDPKVPETLHLQHSPDSSPESTNGADLLQAQKSDSRLELQERTYGSKSEASETSNSSPLHEEGHQGGSDFSSAVGQLQTQTLRLQINTPVPDRIHVKCRHCRMNLEVPYDLPPCQTGLQKLRCGACWKISRFRLNHLLSPSGSSSPGASEFSPGSSFQLGPLSPNGSFGSGAASLPPSAKHNARVSLGSKLSNMSTGGPGETSECTTPSTSGEIGPHEESGKGGREYKDMPPSSTGEPFDQPESPLLTNTSQDSGADQLHKPSPDHRVLHSSSESDEEKPSASLNLNPSGSSSLPKNSWPASDPPEFDDSQEFRGLRGFFKKSVQEFTKGKKSNQYRRKVIVNNHAVPDDVVKRAEEYAGPIHPGSYWYVMSLPDS